MKCGLGGRKVVVKKYAGKEIEDPKYMEHSRIQNVWNIHSFNNCLLGTYYVLGTPSH